MSINYRSEIDGLRALAVIPVILFHAGLNGFSGGYVGVDIFFVLSGYLITSILLGEMSVGTYTIVNFYERRARRILPALFFVIFCSLIPAWVLMAPHQLKDFSQSLVAVAAFSSNILFWKESGYFEVTAELKPLLHTWSLSVEEQFYVIFPLCLALLYRYGKSTLIYATSIVTLLSLTIAQWASTAEPSGNFFLLPTRAWELLAGSLIAYKIFGTVQVKRQNLWEWVGFILIISSIVTYDENTPFPSLWTVPPVLGTCLIIYFSGPTTNLGRLLSYKPVVNIGLISFSLYLWHQPVLAFVRIWRPELLHNGSIIVAVLVLIYLLSRFTYSYVEQPFRSRQKVNSRSVLIFSLTGTISIASVGYMGHTTDGFLNIKLATIPTHKRDLLIDVNTELEMRTVLVNQQTPTLTEPFSSTASGNQKILVVGDSIAEDLATALASEQNLFPGKVFGYIKTSKQCLNDFPNHAKDTNKSGSDICNTTDISKNIQIKNADTIIVSFLWKSDFNFESVTSFINSLKEINKNILILGHGAFLDISSIAYQIASSNKNITQDEIDKIIAESRRSEYDQGNDRLVEIAENLNIRYQDRRDLYCKKVNRCQILFENGDSVLFDGAHLTTFGMQRIARKISEINWLD